jgi:FtsP/CotA-like multicopper oxidase with cupredoxin domain
VVRRVVLGMTMMAREFTINGRAFDEDRVDFRGREGDLEIWEIENPTGMDHPFHLHTYSFQVLSRNGVPDAFPAWKDVVNVRPREVVRIAVPLRDFTGKTVYHCHIVEHEDRGMMGVLEV